MSVGTVTDVCTVSHGAISVETASLGAIPWRVFFYALAKKKKLVVWMLAKGLSEVTRKGVC